MLLLGVKENMVRIVQDRAVQYLAQTGSDRCMDVTLKYLYTVQVEFTPIRRNLSRSRNLGERKVHPMMVAEIRWRQARLRPWNPNIKPL
jgi:hypothetical protein